VLGTGAIQIVLRRTLNDDEMNEWIRLEELVSQVQLTLGYTGEGRNAMDPGRERPIYY